MYKKIDVIRFWRSANHFKGSSPLLQKKIRQYFQIAYYLDKFKENLKNKCRVELLFKCTFNIRCHHISTWASLPCHLIKNVDIRHILLTCINDKDIEFILAYLADPHCAHFTFLSDSFYLSKRLLCLTFH